MSPIHCSHLRVDDWFFDSQRDPGGGPETVIRRARPDTTNSYPRAASIAAPDGYWRSLFKPGLTRCASSNASQEGTRFHWFRKRVGSKPAISRISSDQR